MARDSASDDRNTGYLMVFGGLLNAAIAVDRIFFHKTSGLRWVTATAALVFLVGGTWMIIKRRAPLDWMDDWARERWGPRGAWLVTTVFLALVVAGTWLLSRLD
jgi:hypothetical protein